MRSSGACYSAGGRGRVTKGANTKCRHRVFPRERIPPIVVALINCVSEWRDCGICTPMMCSRFKSSTPIRLAPPNAPARCSTTNRDWSPTHYAKNRRRISGQANLSIRRRERHQCPDAAATRKRMATKPAIRHRQKPAWHPSNSVVRFVDTCQRVGRRIRSTQHSLSLMR